MELLNKEEIVINNNVENKHYQQMNQLYDECLHYLKKCNGIKENHEINEKFLEKHVEERNEDESDDPGYETIKPKEYFEEVLDINETVEKSHIDFEVVNEIRMSESVKSLPELKSERLRKLSQQLPKIIITQSNTTIDVTNYEIGEKKNEMKKRKICKPNNVTRKPVTLNRNSQPFRSRATYGDFPKRLVSKAGIENVALISNVPFGKIRLLNDAFHTLINLRWRWIVIGTVVVHFAIWLVFAVFWYITALAHYDFEPNPPKKTCITGGKDFVTIFLASVEAQTTIGFGDRAIDEECPESIFLFVMQLILGTGLSGVLTCVVYAKLTRPEKLSRDGVGFSKKAVVSVRDGKLSLMFRVWDLNYDHIIGSQFTAHFISTHRTKEGEIVRYFANPLLLQQGQFLLWPVTLIHVIDGTSPLYNYTPEDFASNSYEITVSLKGASASMGTFTQSQSSYTPKEVIWGHHFPPVIKYNIDKQKYVIDHKKLDVIEPVDTPFCSAMQFYTQMEMKSEPMLCPGTPSSFSEKMSHFHLERTSSFRRKDKDKVNRH